MEATLVWAGMWTSIMVGGLLLMPVIAAFFKRNLPICLGIITTLLTIACLSPHSSGAREIWLPLSKVPFELVQATSSLIGRWAGK